MIDPIQGNVTIIPPTRRLTPALPGQDRSAGNQTETQALETRGPSTEHARTPPALAAPPEGDPATRARGETIGYGPAEFSTARRGVYVDILA